MASARCTRAVRTAWQSFNNCKIPPLTRGLATVAPVDFNNRSHRVVVVGGGSAGLSISHQLLRTGEFAPNDIAIIDPAAWHHYQPGWTLVGGGLKTKEELRRPMDSLIDPKIKRYVDKVDTFSPENNFLTLDSNDKISYEQLVVAPGMELNFESIKGLPEALADPQSLVSSIYSYDTCSKVFPSIEKFKKGDAIFTQPAGIVKCAGAPQKIMWLALDHWKRAGLYKASDPTSPIKISFATGLPVMFGVPKYSQKLEQLRKERGVEGLFQHDLLAIDGNTAIFTTASGKEVKKHFDFLHVTPKMGPHSFIRNSSLANEAGYVDVDQSTTRSTKYANIWSAGDASSLPTSKTAAAITSEAPVLVRNLLQTLQGKELDATYDGYTSCPLLTEYGKVMLAEFRYGAEPKETFARLGIDQAVPRRAFWHLKRDFFPWVYWNGMVKGTWGGPRGFIR
ncbi:hypothetical protein FKW77_004868 [Venturia effusa]|uniref:FAD/NAD(P)-binding domain-containing protein n=1 Tax=Venturia effusa TaxID=50376 RepID=A0A517LNW5_9PEZI|nr:hypothetical protein FKW77_004868 [Venturia effusa]